jgi:diguanylate cyclase (GGDEF)-like protein
VLRRIATARRTIIRAVDCFGRLGGQEFTILLPETDYAAAQVTAERIRHKNAPTLIQTELGALSMTASFGVAFLMSVQQDMTAVLDRPDVALYLAKTTDRNRVIAVLLSPS